MYISAPVKKSSACLLFLSLTKKKKTTKNEKAFAPKVRLSNNHSPSRGTKEHERSVRSEENK